MAHWDSEKRITARPSDQPPVEEAEAIDDAGDDDSDLSQVIHVLEWLERNPGWKAQVEAKHGSLLAGVRWALESEETPEERKRHQLLQHALDVAEEESRKQIIAQLADLQHWKGLARNDPKQFRRQLAEVLRTYRTWLNSICGINPHRPSNDDQKRLIYEIKSSKPNWSFGQVAREYSRRTGKPMTAKTAERTYKRTYKPNVEPLLDLSVKMSLSLLKRLRATTKA
jgi:hypothetical protein